MKWARPPSRLPPQTPLVPPDWFHPLITTLANWRLLRCSNRQPFGDSCYIGQLNVFFVRVRKRDQMRASCRSWMRLWICNRDLTGVDCQGWMLFFSLQLGANWNRLLGLEEEFEFAIWDLLWWLTAEACRLGSHYRFALTEGVVPRLELIGRVQDGVVIGINS